MPIEAKIILDSISPDNIRLTTMQLRYPKFIHGEFMTHRVFSRNASSSRAVPTSKLLEEVRSDELRASPIFWGKNQAGMQAYEELDNIQLVRLLPSGEQCTAMEAAKSCWRKAALEAAQGAAIMSMFDVHKQITNLILEPFLHINVLVTATEYDNFFGLRLDKAAQPEMKALAEAMWEARKKSVPTLLQPDQWHLPFVDIKDEIIVADLIRLRLINYPIILDNGRSLDICTRISVARCARISYFSFDTDKLSTVKEDLALYDKLMNQQPLHASPAEHQATPDNKDRLVSQWRNSSGEYGAEIGWRLPHEHGNFIGWRQYRKMLPGENIAPLPEGYNNA